MPDVERNPTGARPPQEPPAGDRTSSVWPFAIVLLIVVFLVVAFVMTRTERRGPVGDTDVEINLPEAKAPEIEVPDKIEVEVPREVEVEVPREVEVDVKTSTQPAQEPAPPPTAT